MFRMSIYILFVLPRQICKEELLQWIPDDLGLKPRFRAMMIGCRQIYHDSHPRYLSLYIVTYSPTLTSKFLWQFPLFWWKEPQCFSGWRLIFYEKPMAHRYLLTVKHWWVILRDKDNSFLCVVLFCWKAAEKFTSERIFNRMLTFDLNKRLHGAYILAGFAVQRERIEGRAVFRKIAIKCFSLFT